MSLVSLGLQARLGSYLSDFGLLGEQSSQKWKILCPWRRWTMHRAKFDAASFILAGEIRNRTNTHTHTHTHTHKTNSNWYIDTLPIGIVWITNEWVLNKAGVKTLSKQRSKHTMFTPCGNKGVARRKRFCCEQFNFIFPNRQIANRRDKFIKSDSQCTNLLTFFNM